MATLPYHQPKGEGEATLQPSDWDRMVGALGCSWKKERKTRDSFRAGEVEPSGLNGKTF